MCLDLWFCQGRDSTTSPSIRLGKEAFSFPKLYRVVECVETLSQNVYNYLRTMLNSSPAEFNTLRISSMPSDAITRELGSVSQLVASPQAV